MSVLFREKEVGEGDTYQLQDGGRQGLEVENKWAHWEKMSSVVVPLAG